MPVPLSRRTNWYSPLIVVFTRRWWTYLYQAVFITRAFATIKFTPPGMFSDRSKPSFFATGAYHVIALI